MSQRPATALIGDAAAVVWPLVAGLAIVVGGCGEDAAGGGEDSSSPTVAQVGEREISRAQLDRWVAVFAGEQPRSGGPVAVPDPPRFERCARALGRQPSPTGERPRSRGERREACRQGYRKLSRRALGFLIQVAWVEREARRRGIELDQEDLDRQLDRELAQAFPTDGDLARYRARSGVTRGEMLVRLRFGELQRRLIARVKRDVEVDDAAVRRHYAANRQLFGAPFDAVEGRVRRALRAEREQRALQTFTSDIAARHVDDTHCKRGYRVAECAGAPTTENTTNREEPANAAR